jgi:phospholipid/cholesterol/gamma-HCH transport system substrate-binding protein
VIAVLIALGCSVAAYIFRHQPTFTFGKSYYTVRAEFTTAAAVTGGQGQAVTIAGVPVGLVGGVKLDQGHAVVTMNIETKYAPIYRDATVLLRPRTPLKDMYLSLDPGDKSAGAIPNGGLIGVAATSADIDVDQILSSLDADTRNYLAVLVSGGAQALGSGGSRSAPSARAIDDLRGTLERLAPISRDTRTFASLLAARRDKVARSIHNLQLVAASLGGVDQELASLIDSASTNFAAISSQDAELQSALGLLPGTINQTTSTLHSVRSFAEQTGPTLHALAPFASGLEPALKASRPLFNDTTPVIRDQLRPFTAAVQPLANNLAPASTKLAHAVPPLSRSLSVINLLLNELAYQPHGHEQGYLFWAAWLSHITASVTDLQDAHGPLVRGLVLANCPALQFIETTLQAGSPAVGPLLDLLNLPDWTKIKSPFCPTGGLTLP